jgi:hypothetical protein
MLRKIIIAFSVFIGLVLALAITIALVYEDQVKKIIVGQINKQLIAPIKVGTIEFSLIKNFPKASLSFYDVAAKSVYIGAEKAACPENIFTAKEISLQFNLKDIFNGNYTINKANVKNVNLYIYSDSKNIDNYHCWKVDSAKSESKVAFKINQIVSEQFEVNYKDMQSQVMLSILFSDALMKGEIYDEDFALLLESKLKIKQIEVNKNQYLSHKNMVINVGLLKINNLYSFKNAEATIEQMKLLLSGSFDEQNIDFNAKAKDLDIQSIISLLPEKWSQRLSDYQSKGQFGLDMSLKGKIKQPQIKLNFAVVNAEVARASSKIALSHLNIKGYYSNGRSQNLHTSGLYVQSFAVSLNNSPIEGKFSLVDFENPFVDCNLHAVFKLHDLKELLVLDTFSVLQGNAQLQLNIACTLEQLKKKDIKLAKEGQIKGSIKVNEGSVKFKSDVLGYDKIEADLYADDNYILVKELHFEHGNSQLSIEGELSNFQTLIGNNKENAVLRAYLHSSNFDLEDWLPKNQQDKGSSSKNEYGYLNAIDLKLNTKIARFKFDKFVANNLSSNIFYKENQFRFDSLKFNCMDGKAAANGAIKLQQKGGFDLICEAKLSKISISKLFEQLNNFGQKTLTDKNIAGKLSAEIIYKSSWSDLNNIIPESILADASVLINDGELNNFTPMNKLSKFVEVNELSHIKFSQLANKISINNQKIYIPEFEIKSSAMNLFCSGTHDFDNQIDYHFRVTLNELLSKKRKREVPKNKEFEEIDDDAEGKTTLFISMTGNVDNPKIKFDKKELKKFVKDEIKNEKMTVKQLLKDEFGLFKKDKNLKEKSDNKASKAKEFEVEWEEEVKTESKEQKPIEKKKEKRIFEGESKTQKSKEKVKPSKEENSDDFL